MSDGPVQWLGDAAVLARVLCDCPPARQAWVLERMLCEAARAGRHLRLYKRVHPLWGNGSLMAVALRRNPSAEPSLNDCGFRAALIMVLRRL